MKKLAVLGIILIVVLAGGALTSYMLANNSALPVPVLTTTVDPNASTQIMVGWKAEQLFLLVGFILFNLIGIAVTIAIVVWFVDRGIRHTRAAQTAIETQPGKSQAG